MALRLKSISKINAKSSINENITIDAKHGDMVKYFKELQKSIPSLKNDLKDLINEYKNYNNKDKSEFEIIMEKNNLRDKINELKDKINFIVEKKEENKYFLEVGVLLHNYYENLENTKNIDSDSYDFEKNLLNMEYSEKEINNDDDFILDDEDDLDEDSEIVPEIIEKKTKEALSDVRYWIDCGDDDFLTIGNAQLHITLTKKQVPHEFRMREGAHNWTYWRTGVIDALSFIGDSFHQK
jgi:hypothetical protein